MAVTELVDVAARQLLEALHAVRAHPAPLGQTAARLAVLAHAARELEGVYLRELSAVDPAALGARSSADLLADAAGLPAWQARSDAALARRLGVLPGLLDAVAGGGVELAAARQLARAWTALPVRLRDDATAEALIALAGLVDLPELRAKVDELVAALAPDVTDDALARARETGELVLVDVGAETRLSGHTDGLQGEWLREVLVARAEADRGLADGRSSGQRLLDALLDCVRAAVGLDEVPSGGGAAPTLVVVAEVEDLLEPERPPAAPEEALAGLLGEPGVPVRRGACSRGGTRLGSRALAAVLCEATLTRLVFGPRRAPLDSSPAARQLSRRERRALEHRAAYRCERRGCGRPAYACVPHHVVPWALGGLSTLANTVLLCRSCHHLLHDRERPLELTGDRCIGPRGWLRTGPAP